VNQSVLIDLTSTLISWYRELNLSDQLRRDPLRSYQDSSSTPSKNKKKNLLYLYSFSPSSLPPWLRWARQARGEGGRAAAWLSSSSTNLPPNKLLPARMGSGVHALMRRKQVGSERGRAAGAHQPRKELSVVKLVAICPDLSYPLFLFYNGPKLMCTIYLTWSNS
jgi:hypothetical protein